MSRTDLFTQGKEYPYNVRFGDIPYTWPPPPKGATGPSITRTSTEAAGLRQPPVVASAKPTELSEEAKAAIFDTAKAKSVPSWFAKSKQLLTKLRGFYKPGYEFPKWSIDMFDQFQQDYEKARIYTNGSSKEEAFELATYREPVNITGKQYYDQVGFDLGVPFYGKFWGDTGRKNIASNIAVYTLSRVNMAEYPCTDPLQLHPQPVHILHCIGAALDSRDQPDYNYFYGRGRTQQEIVEDLRLFYVGVFKIINAAIQEIRPKGLVMSLVGAESFASLYTGPSGSGAAAFQQDVWVPAFLATLKKFEASFTKDFEISFMGAAGSLALGQIQDRYSFISDLGRFPEVIKGREDHLFINAWDPNSFVGNGNCNDNSLDGYIGRHTNSLAASWPRSNQYLTTNRVTVVE
jgi:hypothetical protein